MAMARVGQPNEVTIFGRMLNNGQPKMSPQLARYLLSLGFSAEDRSRMHELAERNQLGQLSSIEHDELLSYVKAGHLLALFHSKARQVLAKKKVS